MLNSLQMLFNILASYISFYFPEQFDPTLKPFDSANCQACRKIQFDFIIVGAGSAGCVLANRLSANPNWNVLLIEAGGDESFITDTPALHNALAGTRYHWNYTTVRQKRACKDNGGMCLYPRGHVMGGSSSVNGMIYTRGNPVDYEEWEALGNPGWGYKDVFKYFHRLENMTDQYLQHSPFHSTWGEQSVGFSRYKARIYSDILQAGFDFGLNQVDYNGHNQIGVSYSQLTIDGATRMSTSKAYLNPIRNRKNLYVFKNTRVSRVLIDSNTRTAVGVRCMTGNEEYEVFTKKEVVLSAGAVNTPQILMLSGVGPREHLQEFGIPVIADLPVGRNLIDHNNVRVNFMMGNENYECYKEYGKNIALRYAKDGQGELASNMMEMVAFLNRHDNAPYFPPDVQFHFALGNAIFMEAEDSCLSLLVTHLSPKSRGSIKLQSTDPKTPPLIDPNYYSVEEDYSITAWGVRQALAYLKAPTINRYQLRLIVNESCAQYQDQDAFLKCFIEHQTGTIYHPCSTTRMGPAEDKSSVVSPELRVHTINQLRVADAGIMPKITRGNTNAPTIMIGEKASDLIINSYTTRRGHDVVDYFNFFGAKKIFSNFWPTI